MNLITPYKGNQPIDDFGQQFASLKYSGTLAANTPSTLTIPGDAPRYKALIRVQAPGIVWVANNATAAVAPPAAGTLTTSTSELITNYGTICREVKSGDVLSFVSATANTVVGVVLYGMPV